LGLNNLRKLPVDEDFALIPEELEKAIVEDRANGLTPLAVVAAIGTTSSTAVDPLKRIGEICKTNEVWLHVDAAYAGTAAILPEMRWILDGAENADSIVINPHKWLMTNLHCTAYWVKDVEALLSTMSTDPEYLKTAHDQEAVNFRDWGIPLGRRFRALKLWFVIRSYGVEGLQELIRGHIELAQKFRSWVEQHPDFEILAPSPFGLVCFRFNPDGRYLSENELDALNERLLKEVNSDGRVHLTHTVLRGQYTIRLVVGQRTTTEQHVRLAWELIREALH
jgi:aromatic-L-amino-acid decarboxylase